MFELKDIFQIILIPLITIILGNVLDVYKDKSKRNREKDITIFTSIQEKISGEIDLVWFFRDVTSGAPTEKRFITGVLNLNNLLETPGCIFLNQKLEKKRNQLLGKIQDYIEITIKNMFPSKNLPDHYELRYYGVRNDDEATNQKFISLYVEIDKISTDIFHIWSQLVTDAQRIL